MNSNALTPVKFFEDEASRPQKERLERAIRATMETADAPGPIDPVEPTPEIPVNGGWQTAKVNKPFVTERQLPSLQMFTRKCAESFQDELESVAKWLLATKNNGDTTVSLQISGIILEINVSSVDVQEKAGFLILTVSRNSKMAIKMAPGTELKVEWPGAESLQPVTYFGDLTVAADFPYYFMLFLLERNP